MSIQRAQLSAISRLFSPSVVREMYKRRSSPLFARLARETGLLCKLSHSNLVSDFFEAAFASLRRKSCRDEYIYRSAIAHRILMGRHSLNTAAMLNEFRVGDRVADVVILNGTSTVYEIKSERDTLKRLAWQTTAYNNVFAETYVIVGDNHIDSVLRSVRPEVGVMSLSDRFYISTIRQAKREPEKTVPLSILDSVRIAEAKAILSLMGASYPHVPNTQMHSALSSVFRKLDPASTHDAMVRVLRKTRSSRSLSQFVGSVPVPLRAALLSTRPNKPSYLNLKEAIGTTIREALQWG